MTKFTPGPWKFLHGEMPESLETLVVPPENDTTSGKGWLSKSISIGNSGNECLAEVKTYTTDGFMQDFNQFEYNARLILAAPEMYELLEGVINGNFPDETIVQELLDKINQKQAVRG